jgi:ADP-ribose pyrophosphatase YjhB (NUDIX family)
MQRLRWVQRLQTITQAGLTYTRDAYDRERYEQLRELAAEIASASDGDGDAEARAMLGVLGAEKGYATPKVDVRAVVAKGGKLLFMREAQDGLWSLPGGWADIGESASEVAVREVREETGYSVRATKLLAVYDKAKHEHPPDFWYCYKLFVRCELVSEAPDAAPRSLPSYGHETLDVGFFGPHELPPLSLPRVTEAQVRRMFEHAERAELATDFD